MRYKGLLLDRDGIINADHGYIGSVEQFSFMTGLFPFLRTACNKGFRLAILTNQSGVARGLYTEAAFEELTAWMLKQLKAEDIIIDLVLACFEHTGGNVLYYKRESFWRKPNPGMVLEAIQKLDLDPKRAVFLGDKITDMQAAQAGGIKHCWLLDGRDDEAPGGVHRVRDFAEAATLLPL